MIHLNIVSISRSRSNSMSNTKDSEKSAYFILFFCYCIKGNLNGKKFLKQSKQECIGFE